MSKDKEIAALIKVLAESNNAVVFNAEVVSVEDESCTVSYLDVELSDVKYSSVIDGEELNMRIKPTVGSLVTVIDTEGDLRDLYIIKYSQTEQITINSNIDADGEIVINGGDLGGLINISDLTNQLNNLVSEFNAFKDQYNSHIHITTATVGPSATPGTISPTTSQASPASNFSKDDYEDPNVLH